MEYYLKLPRNKKETAIFMGIISLISVNIIAPLITCFEMGFSFAVWKNVLGVLPVIWTAVIALVLITHGPAGYLTKKIAGPNDSFSATFLINTLCTVFWMSICMTVAGAWIGSGRISLDPVYHFFYKWPRNFTIAFGVETFIAQPIARFVMIKMHRFQEMNDRVAAIEK